MQGPSLLRYVRYIHTEIKVCVFLENADILWSVWLEMHELEILFAQIYHNVITKIG